MRRLPIASLALVLALVLAAPAAAATTCGTGWRLTGTDTFRGADALARSQGATTDGRSWFFSWQGGLQHTLDNFVPIGADTLPPELALEGDNHIGDIDHYNGLIYAPVEDGDAYQHPHIALYDATTLLYTGKSYALDVGLHEAGVPWVAVDRRRAEVYTGEWDMPHDRLNVFDTHMRFKRFLPLSVHLPRIQGAKVSGHTMYATVDDSAKSVYAIDLRTGVVTKLFSLDPGVPAELEGLALRRTGDGALLHVLIVLDNQLPDDATKIRVEFRHYAPPCPG